MYGMEAPVKSLHDYNPRCIRRDLNPHILAKFFTTENLLKVTIGGAPKTIKSFQDEFNGRPQEKGFLGLRKFIELSHINMLDLHWSWLKDLAGHYTLNGENTDFYTSVNDPAFFLHHAMIDRAFLDLANITPVGS